MGLLVRTQPQIENKMSLITFGLLRWGLLFKTLQLRVIFSSASSSPSASLSSPSYREIENEVDSFTIGEITNRIDTMYKDYSQVNLLEGELT